MYAMYFVFMLVVLGTFKLTVEFTEDYPNHPPQFNSSQKCFILMV